MVWSLAFYRITIVHLRTHYRAMQIETNRARDVDDLLGPLKLTV